MGGVAIRDYWRKESAFDGRVQQASGDELAGVAAKSTCWARWWWWSWRWPGAGVKCKAQDLPLSETPCDGRTVIRGERGSDIESESAGGRSVSVSEGVVCGIDGEREGASGKGAQHLPRRGSLRACDGNKHASTAGV